jgi:transposase
MPILSTPPIRILGCDVGKSSVVIFDTASGSGRSVPNRKPDLLRLARTLGPDCLVVCEATGGYEAKLLDAMLAAGVAAHRADARKVKAFIRSFGILGKSDAIDAQALARFGAERWKTLALWEQPDPVREQLQALVLLRIDLVKLRQAQANRLAAPQARFVAASLKALIHEIDKQLRAVAQQIRELVGRHPALKRDAEVLRSIPGIGEITAHALAALMPELGALGGAQAAALAGVAPHPHESGRRVGYRKTRGGRPDVKRTLFMAALSASRAAGSLSSFYQRLVKRGKKPIVAITALMRKLIVIANARLRDARNHHTAQLMEQVS